jgi:hypothetical protein
MQRHRAQVMDRGYKDAQSVGLLEPAGVTQFDSVTVGKL